MFLYKSLYDENHYLKYFCVIVFFVVMVVVDDSTYKLTEILYALVINKMRNNFFLWSFNISIVDYFIPIFLSNFSLFGWDCRIQLLHLCSEVHHR